MEYAGMSTYLDTQLGTIQVLLKEAQWLEKEGEFYWRDVNIGVAERLSVSHLSMVTDDGIAREILQELFKKITEIPKLNKKEEV